MAMKPATILVVEDENIIAKDLTNRLSQMGFAVSQVASSGEEAIRVASVSKPDLVLMDIGLRGRIDGIEAARSIQTHLHIPVVFLTAYPEDHLNLQPKLDEPAGYVAKPFEDGELYSALKRFFAKPSTLE
jgi:CheY-like chemotaxis protein